MLDWLLSLHEIWYVAIGALMALAWLSISALVSGNGRPTAAEDAEQMRAVSKPAPLDPWSAEQARRKGLM